MEVRARFLFCPYSPGFRGREPFLAPRRFVTLQMDRFPWGFPGLRAPGKAALVFCIDDGLVLATEVSIPHAGY